MELDIEAKVHDFLIMEGYERMEEGLYRKDNEDILVEFITHTDGL